MTILALMAIISGTIYPPIKISERDRPSESFFFLFGCLCFVLLAMQKNFPVEENGNNASVIQRIEKNQVCDYLFFVVVMNQLHKGG